MGDVVRAQLFGRLYVCVRCGAVGSRRDFVADRRANNGTDSWCRSCKRESAREWRAKNPSLVNAYARQYRLGHPERRAERQRRYARAHPEKAVARAARWRDAHPGKAAEYRRNRRAREANAPGSHTVADIRDQLARQRGRCFWCWGKVGPKYHVDHVTPLALGGSNGPENLVVACPSCNLEKKAAHPMDWAGVLC